MCLLRLVSNDDAALLTHALPARRSSSRQYCNVFKHSLKQTHALTLASPYTAVETRS